MKEGLTEGVAIFTILTASEHCCLRQRLSRPHKDVALGEWVGLWKPPSSLSSSRLEASQQKPAVSLVSFLGQRLTPLDLEITALGNARLTPTQHARW